MSRHVKPRSEWKAPPGPKVHPIRRGIMEQFDIKPARAHRDLPLSYCEQLNRCADDAARRILLGKSEKGATGFGAEMAEEKR